AVLGKGAGGADCVARSRLSLTSSKIATRAKGKVFSAGSGLNFLTARLHCVEFREHVFDPCIIRAVADLSPLPITLRAEHPILRDGVAVEQIDHVGVGGN